MSLCTVARYFYSSPTCGNTPDRRSSHFLQASRWPGRNRRCCRRSRPDRERGVMAAPVVVARGTKSFASTAGLAAAGEAVGCRDRGSLARHRGITWLRSLDRYGLNADVRTPCLVATVSIGIAARRYFCTRIPMAMPDIQLVEPPVGCAPRPRASARCQGLIIKGGGGFPGPAPSK